jgi:hypothetical protein
MSLMAENDPAIPKPMSDALNRYDSESTKVLEEFLRVVEAKKPPPILYHYTNDIALKAIIQSGKIWFSDIFRQNDPSELRYGLTNAIDILKSRISETRPELTTFASQFERFDLDAGIEAVAHYFICCFSGDGDDLGQWRAYANNGQGFALGFDTRSFEEAFANEKGAEEGQNSTFPITYSVSDLTSIQSAITDLIDPLISLPRTIPVPSNVMHAYMRELLVYHSLHVIRGVMFFKHEAYKNEKEYRFQQLFRGDLPVPELKYRQRQSTLVRYREFDWRSCAPQVLRKVVVGPAASRAEATRFVKDCLAAYHADPHAVELVYSKIPYRV